MPQAMEIFKQLKETSPQQMEKINKHRVPKGKISKRPGEDLFGAGLDNWKNDGQENDYYEEPEEDPIRETLGVGTDQFNEVNG